MVATPPYRSLEFRKINPQNPSSKYYRDDVGGLPNVHTLLTPSELEVDSQNVLADIDAACTDIRDFIKSGSRRTRLLSREEHEAARQDDGVLGHHGPLTASIETVLDSPDVLDCPVSVDRLSRQHSS